MSETRIVVNDSDKIEGTINVGNIFGTTDIGMKELKRSRGSRFRKSERLDGGFPLDTNDAGGMRTSFGNFTRRNLERTCQLSKS